MMTSAVDELPHKSVIVNTRKYVADAPLYMGCGWLAHPPEMG